MDKYQIAIFNIKFKRTILSFFVGFMSLFAILTFAMSIKDLLLAKMPNNIFDIIGTYSSSFGMMFVAILLVFVIIKTLKFLKKQTNCINRLSIGDTDKEFFTIIKKRRNQKSTDFKRNNHLYTSSYVLEVENQRKEKKEFRTPVHIFDNVLTGDVVMIEFIEGYEGVIDVTRRQSTTNTSINNGQEPQFWEW